MPISYDPSIVIQLGIPVSKDKEVVMKSKIDEINNSVIPPPIIQGNLHHRVTTDSLIFITMPVFSAFVLLVVLMLYDMSEQEALDPIVYIFFMTAACIIIAVSARLNYVIHERERKKVILPLQQLELAAKAIQYGNYNVVVDYHGNDELGQVCNSFRTMQAYLKSTIAERVHANTNRKILFSGIAHDLRTPLTAIMGYTEALQLGLGKTEEKRNQYLNSISACADDLSKLIDELSLYNKLSTSRIICHPHPVNFNDVIHNFIEEDKDYLLSRQLHISFDMEENLIAMIDEKEFQRVLFNLLTNTIKYRIKDTSEVMISLKAKRNYAEFSYQDDGPGVPEEKLSHIFEAFYRTDEARSKTSNGSGLGLAIVAEIITAHKGRYRAINQHGLKLIFEIPLAEGSSTK